tara:strand:- start:266 stop:469 length:204 start_codon:yes stop_codon:yes gene_type:complete
VGKRPTASTTRLIKYYRDDTLGVIFIEGDLSMDITVVELLLVIGTFGICSGVWVTLAVIIKQGKGDN